MILGPHAREEGSDVKIRMHQPASGGGVNEVIDLPDDQLHQGGTPYAEWLVTYGYASKVAEEPAPVAPAERAGKRRGSRD